MATLALEHGRGPLDSQPLQCFLSQTPRSHLYAQGSPRMQTCSLSHCSFSTCVHPEGILRMRHPQGQDHLCLLLTICGPIPSSKIHSTYPQHTATIPCKYKMDRLSLATASVLPVGHFFVPEP